MYSLLLLFLLTVTNVTAVPFDQTKLWIKKKQKTIVQCNTEDLQHLSQVSRLTYERDDEKRTQGMEEHDINPETFEFFEENVYFRMLFNAYFEGYQLGYHNKKAKPPLTTTAKKNQDNTPTKTPDKLTAQLKAQESSTYTIDGKSFTLRTPEQLRQYKWTFVAPCNKCNGKTVNIVKEIDMQGDDIACFWATPLLSRKPSDMKNISTLKTLYAVHGYLKAVGIFETHTSSSTNKDNKTQEDSKAHKSNTTSEAPHKPRQSNSTKAKVATLMAGAVLGGGITAAVTAVAG
ncbi:MAG: hypothetical protein V6Z78_04575 [Holosporaceae bacterium]